MHKHSSLPVADGLYWYFARGEEQPRPVMIDKARWGGSFKSFNGAQQSWLRDGEYLLGPQPVPTAQDVDVGTTEQRADALHRTTDPDSYRALCEALVEAESANQIERAATLRAMVDAAAFSQCPDCEDKADRRDECVRCGGDGFIPDTAPASDVQGVNDGQH